MVLRKLGERAKSIGLGLAGLVALGGAGKASSVSAQEVADIFANRGRTSVEEVVPENVSDGASLGFAKKHGHLVRAGAYNERGKWTNGSEANRTPPKVSRVGVYGEIGYGFTPNCTGFAQLGVENPGFGDGMANPDNPKKTFNISPNHFVPRVGIGMRVKKDSKDKRFALVGEGKYSVGSDFMDHTNWSGGSHSEIEVYSDHEMSGSVLGVVRPGLFNGFEALGDLELLGGAKISSKYVRGRTKTFYNDGGKPVVGELYPRDKARVTPQLGVNYGKFGALTDGKGVSVTGSWGF